MQFQPDWSMTGSPEQLEKELINFKFGGPGWYLTNTDTLLIVPQPPENPPTFDNIWHMKQPEGTIYRVYVYNTNVNNLIFGTLGFAPTRQDDRE